MRKTAFCVLALFLAASASAETGYQLAAGGARTPDDPNVSGFRLSFLYGENEKMSGFDFGLLSLSSSRNSSWRGPKARRSPSGRGASSTSTVRRTR